MSINDLDKKVMEIMTHNAEFQHEKNEILKKIIKDYEKYWRIFSILVEKLKPLEFLDLELNRKVTSMLLYQKMKNEEHKNEIKVIDKILKKNSINYILLKGGAYNMFLYEGSEARCCSDIDILVLEQDYDKVLSLFETHEPASNIKTGPLAGIYEETRYLKKAGYQIDIHKNLIYPYIFNLCMRKIFEESIAIDEIKVMSIEWQLIHQCLHVFRDQDLNIYKVIEFLKLLKLCNDKKKLEIMINETGVRNIFEILMFHSGKRGMCDVDWKTRLCLKILYSEPRNSILKIFKKYFLFYLMPDRKMGVIKLYWKYMVRSIGYE